MQTDLELAHNWRRAFFALFITILAGALKYAATGGPGLVFYIVGAVVFALLGFDLVIRARVESADRAAAKAATALRLRMAASHAPKNAYSSQTIDGASVIGGSS
jgi:hypothetical protein